MNHALFTIVDANHHSEAATYTLLGNKPMVGQAVFTRTKRQGVDVVVDNVGKDTLFGSIRALRKGGRILIVGNTSGPLAEVDLRYIFRKQISIIGSTMAPHSDFVRVMGLVFDGVFIISLAGVAVRERIDERGRLAVQ